MSTSSSTSLGEERPETPSSPREKSVVFGPLSPRSSKALLQLKQDKGNKGHLSDEDESPSPHHQPRSRSSQDISYDERPRSHSRSGEREIIDRERTREERPRPRRRRSSDPSSDRPTNIGSLRRRRKDNSDSEEDVEELPDRFDSHGRPLDRPRWTSRSGVWEARDPSGREHSHGAWSITGGGIGKDGIAMEQIVKEVTDVIEGRESWIGLVGKVLGGGLLEPPPPDQERHGYRRSHSSDSSRRHRHHHDHDDEGRRHDRDRGNDPEHGSRSRRRRRRDDDDDGRDDGDWERDFGHRRKLSLDDSAVTWGSGDWDGGDDGGDRRRKRR